MQVLDFSGAYYNNRALTFNGTSDYLDGDNFAIPLTFNSPASFSFWYKPIASHLTTNSIIFTASRNPENSANRFFIGYGPVTSALANEVLTVVKNNSVIGFVDSNDIYVNNWNHFVIIQNGTTSIFYHNGNLKSTSIGASTADNGLFGDGILDANKDTWRWMNRPISSAYGTGSMDEMSIWNKELTAADVSEIYNGGNPDNLLEHPAADNLIAWWSNGDGNDDAINGALGNNPNNRIYDEVNGYYLTPSSTMTNSNFTNDVP